MYKLGLEEAEEPEIKLPTCVDHRESEGLPGSSAGKESTCNAGDLGLIPGLGRSPGVRKWQPTPVFMPGESHRQRSLVGYHPWGCKEPDRTEAT